MITIPIFLHILITDGSPTLDYGFDFNTRELRGERRGLVHRRRFWQWFSTTTSLNQIPGAGGYRVSNQLSYFPAMHDMLSKDRSVLCRLTTNSMQLFEHIMFIR